MKRTKSTPSCDPDTAPDTPIRERILGAAFKAFTETGYQGTSTLEIATRAKVSKRELYAEFGSKQAVLVACIAGRVARMRMPPDLPAPRDRKLLAAALTSFGSIVVREVCHPAAMAMFRLAVAEAERAPEVAQALDAAGRAANHAAVATLLARAQSAGLIGAGDPLEMARQYLALLWEDLLIRLLLRLAKPPNPDEIERRAKRATTGFLQLHPEPPRPR